MYDGSFIYSQKKKKKIKKTSKILSEREMKHFSTSEINSDRHQKAKALYLSHKGSKVGKKKSISDCTFICSDQTILHNINYIQTHNS